MSSRFWSEIGAMVEQKMVQGAAELGKALNSQADAYVPYGDGQKMPEAEGVSTQFQDMLRDGAQRGQEPEREMER